jgi:Fe-S-cluster containining protein
MKTKTKQCLRCGDCCSSKTLLKQCNEEEIMLFKLIYKLQGADINNTPCPHLDFKLGMAVCKIYNDRPWFCKEHYCERCK